MPVPVDTSAPLPDMLLPTFLQQRRPLPLPDLVQACINGIPPTGVEHHGTQVKRRCLEGCLEDIRNLHEDDVPHEQSEKSGPNATLCMGACGHAHTHTDTLVRLCSAMLASRRSHVCWRSRSCTLLLQKVLHADFARLGGIKLLGLDGRRRAAVARFARDRAQYPLAAQTVDFAPPKRARTEAPRCTCHALLI